MKLSEPNNKTHISSDATSADKPTVKLRVICFAYAGGSTRVFSDWAASLPDNVEVLLPVLPGRESRFSQKAHDEWSPLLDEMEHYVSQYSDLPFMLFGHSFGARIAFELATRLAANGKPLPSQIIVSGCRAPSIEGRKPHMHKLESPALYEKMQEMCIIEQELLDCPKIMKIVEPTIRADMKLAELWPFAPRGKLSVPIAAFAGENDCVDSVSDIALWRDYTTEDFSMYRFDGNHSFIHGLQSQVVGKVSDYCQKYTQAADWINESN